MLEVKKCDFDRQSVELLVCFYLKFPQILQKPHLRLQMVRLSEIENHALLMRFAHNSRPNLDWGFIVTPYLVLILRPFAK